MEVAKRLPMLVLFGLLVALSGCGHAPRLPDGWTEPTPPGTRQCEAALREFLRNDASTQGGSGGRLVVALDPVAQRQTFEPETGPATEVFAIVSAAWVPAGVTRIEDCPMVSAGNVERFRIVGSGGRQVTLVDFAWTKTLEWKVPNELEPLITAERAERSYRAVVADVSGSYTQESVSGD